MSYQKLELVNCLEKANAITHGGKFHADDVFSTVLLLRAFNKDLKLYRCISSANHKDAPEKIYYDIGRGKYDHHQNDNIKRRYNGIIYSSFGLLWEDYYETIISSYIQENNIVCPIPEKQIIQSVKKILENQLIMGIDAQDNGQMPRIRISCSIASVSSVVSSFNPRNTLSTTICNEAFVKAVEFMKEVFDNYLWNTITQVIDEENLRKALRETKEAFVIVEFIPDKYDNIILNYEKELGKNILFIIGKSKRSNYTVRAIRKAYNSKEFKLLFPQEWAGLNEGSLRKTSRFKSITFCHNNRFLIGINNLDEAKQLTRKLIRNYHKNN